MYKNIITQDFGDHINLIVECPFCHKPSTIKLDAVKTKLFEEGMQKWQNGMRVQDAMPFLSPSERELLLSGMCDKCWSSM